MATPQSVFVNLTSEEERVERKGSHGPKALDFSALKGNTLGEGTISFLLTTEDIKVLPSEGSIVSSIFTDGLDEVATKHDEPIIWILTDYLGLTNGLDTRIRLLVCGEFFLVGLIKGRIFLETDDGVATLDRDYRGIREEPVWFIPEEFPNLSSSETYRDNMWDLTVRATQYGNSDRFIDYRSKPTPGYPVLIDGGYWKDKRIKEQEAKLQKEEAKRQAKENAIIERELALEKEQQRKASEISAEFLSLLQAKAEKKAG